VKKRKSTGALELEADGFTDIRRIKNDWYVAKIKNEEICFLRQGPRAWHAFFSYRATGSGGSPLEALTGGLGDVIGDSFDMKNYRYRVRNAPEALSLSFDGLYEAGAQIING